jgi:hypothetical protein
MAVQFRHLPGGDVVEQGLADLERGIESVPGLVAAIGSPRLRSLGIAVPLTTTTESPELRLYALVSTPDDNGGHARYNALIRRLVSFERALACER